MKDNEAVKDTENKYAVGIVFGVFDGFHEGHKYLLSEAAKLTQKLVVVLTLPETSELLKGKKPRHSYEERARAIQAFNPKVILIPADREPGVWSVFRTYPKACAILGYDQQGIAKELEKQKVAFVFLKPYHPDIYKSSILFR